MNLVIFNRWPGLREIIIDIGFEVKQEHVQSVNPLENSYPLIIDQSILQLVSNCRRMPNNLLDPVDIRLHKAINDGKHIACLFAFNTNLYLIWPGLQRSYTNYIINQLGHSQRA